MANTTSAKKATRKIARRTIVNKSRRTQMRGAIRVVEEAIAKGDRDAAIKAMVRAEPELMQGKQRAVVSATVRGKLYYRALVRGFVDRAAASAFCRALSDRGRACFLRG